MARKQQIIIAAVLMLTVTVVGYSGCGSKSGKDRGTVVASDTIILFNESGEYTKPGQLEAVVKLIHEGKITDVFLAAHGWNNSYEEAATSYNNLAAITLEAAKGPQGQDTLPIDFHGLLVGVYWPSKAWDEGPIPEAASPPPLTPQQMDALKASCPVGPDAARDADVETLKALAEKPKEETNKEDWQKALSLFRKHSIKPAKVDNDSADNQSVFDPPKVAPETPLDFADILKNRFGSVRQAARVFTFWQMKKRAGIVGNTGFSALLRTLQQKAPEVKFHLVGHSFGCKLILSGLNASKPVRPAKTVVLLQGALSSYAFSDAVPGTNPSMPGGYKSVLTGDRVRGPIVATYSKNDLPLNYAYPLGSWLVNASGELEGASDDRFAAMGAKGIANVHAVTIKQLGEAYGFADDSTPTNIAGTAVIDSHSGIYHPPVGWLIWCATARH